MNIWLLLLGIAGIVGGIFILLDRERALRLSQKHLRQNVGQLGDAVAERAKPSAMNGPGIGAILIGASLVFQTMTQAPTPEVTNDSSAGEGEGLNIMLLLLGIVWTAVAAQILFGRTRALGWSQKRFRQDAGQLREVFPEEGKPRRMIVPAIVNVVIGILLVFAGFTEAFIA